MPNFLAICLAISMSSRTLDTQTGRQTALYNTIDWQIYITKYYVFLLWANKSLSLQVYVPDLRNHGRSPWAKEMNYDVLTNDVCELMQQYNIPKAILIGSSMGGRIAMNFSLKYVGMFLVIEFILQMLKIWQIE